MRGLVERRTRHDRYPSAVEDYVRVIYAMAEGGSAITVTTLAHAIGVTPASTSTMLTRLKQLGLVKDHARLGRTLTKTGDVLAMQVLRRRRLIESFLVASLDYHWGEVEVEAERLSRAASDQFIDRIAARLAHPAVDPHGDPIPTADGRLVSPVSYLLADIEPGTTGRLARVWNGDHEVIRYLDSHAIGLGSRIELLSREPFGAPLMVRVGEQSGEGRIHGFGLELATVLSIQIDS